MDKELLRRVQLAQFEIAKEVKRVCEKNKIAYFLDSGTLLGAVRHHGFIPWDDDMDLGMLRDQYEMFLKAAVRDLDKKFQLVEWKSSNGYPRPFCKIVKKNTIYLEEGAKESEYERGIYIDIFPYDVFPNKADSIQKRQINLYKAVIRNQCGIKTWVSNGKINKGKYLKNLPITLLSHLIDRNSAISRYEKSAIKHNGENSEYYYPQGVSGYGRWIIPRKCLQNYEVLEFEGEMFSVPSDYDAFLKHAYGDYMKLPPEDQRENRHKIIQVDFGEKQ